MDGSDWHPEDIKAAIRKTGISTATLAREGGVGRGAIHQALRLAWPRIERLIADRIGLTPQEIWPSRYDSEGNPLKGLHALPHNRRPADPAPHRQNGAAR